MRQSVFDRVAAILVIVSLLAGPASAAAPQDPPPDLAITLAPGGVDDDGDPRWIDVTTRVEGFAVGAGAPLVRTPVKFAGVSGVAWQPDDIEISDQRGAVPLTVAVDDPDAGGFLYWRRYLPQRATEGPVSLTYRAPIELVIPRLGGGPPFDLRAQGGGVSGAFNTFLLMPDTSQPFTIRIHWDLEALAPGSIGVTSFGDGDTTDVGTVDRLVATFIMAGPIGRYPADDPDARFRGYWIGEPRFDAAALLEWSERAYDMIVEFFGDEDPPVFRVLMRPNPYQGGGGSALMSSYLLSFPETLEDGESLRGTIAHETLHNWGPRIDGPPGSTSWFSEGMVVHYTRELLFRSGMYTEEEFLDSVNGTATGYYTNPLNDLPNDRIAERFWEDTRVRTLPYARGSLYFADVDAKVRAATGGDKSLDDLLMAFKATTGDDLTGSPGTWRELVVAELGEAGGDDLDAMLKGRLIVPPDDAFGPCFEREKEELRRFELGFDRSVLTTEPRIVEGLVAGSAAAAAGLENGDQILRPVALEAAQSDPEKTLELEVRRGERRFTVEYLPRSEPVTGYRWVRKPHVAAAECD